MNEFTYELFTNEFGAEFLLRTNPDKSVSWIPLDESNSDYQAYLASLNETTVTPEIIEPVEESEPTELADEPSPDTE
jgi:hypothetical protein